MNVSSGERRFSHVGVVSLFRGQPVVIHAIYDVEKKRDGVVVDAIHSFLSEADDWAVYRVNMRLELRNKIAELAIDANAASIPFDNQFDLASEDHVYCTEFVWRIVNRVVGSDLVKATISFGNRKIVAISDVYADESVQFVIGAESIMSGRTLVDNSLLTTE